MTGKNEGGLPEHMEESMAHSTPHAGKKEMSIISVMHILKQGA